MKNLSHQERDIVNISRGEWPISGITGTRQNLMTPTHPLAGAPRHKVKGSHSQMTTNLSWLERDYFFLFMYYLYPNLAFIISVPSHQLEHLVSSRTPRTPPTHTPKSYPDHRWQDKVKGETRTRNSKHLINKVDGEEPVFLSVHLSWWFECDSMGGNEEEHLSESTKSSAQPIPLRKAGKSEVRFWAWAQCPSPILKIGEWTRERCGISRGGSSQPHCLP